MTETSETGIDSTGETLEYDGSETHQCQIEGEVTRHYYDCPSCGFPISTWMDCPDCGWFDEDVWNRTVDSEAGA